MDDVRLGDVVRVYFEAKALMLYAEETDGLPDLKEYLQPTLELRSASDHLMRAHAAELGNNDEKGEAYVKDNLEKSLGHAYRAFFDVADWLAINLRELIASTLSGHSKECIHAALPDYYAEIRPGIDQISDDIAGIRGKKDVSNPELLPQYKEKLGQLDAYRKVIASRLGAIVECEAQRSREDTQAKTFAVILATFSALVGGLAGYLMGKFW